MGIVISMKIKFLKEVNIRQQKWITHCDCCGPEMDGWVDTNFMIGEEIDPEEFHNQVDISGLKYKIDYEITEYP